MNVLEWNSACTYLTAMVAKQSRHRNPQGCGQRVTSVILPRSEIHEALWLSHFLNVSPPDVINRSDVRAKERDANVAEAL